MITIQETQDKLLDLINSRLSVRQLATPGVENPMRMLGEKMLNMFAGQMISDSMLAEQKEDIKEELLETVMSLHMHNPKIYLGQVRRDDISFTVRDYDPPKGSYDLNKYKQTIEHILQIISSNTKTIMYFPVFEACGAQTSRSLI